MQQTDSPIYFHYVVGQKGVILCSRLVWQKYSRHYISSISTKQTLFKKCVYISSGAATECLATECVVDRVPSDRVPRDPVPRAQIA